MNVHLHIERLVLDGVPIEPRGGRMLQAVVEAELTRLLAVRGIPRALLAGGMVPTLHAPPVQLPPGGEPAALGAQTARSVYRSLGR